MLNAARSGESLYQPRFPWWEPFETRLYPVIHKDRHESLSLLLRVAIQGDRKPGLQAVEFRIDGTSTTLEFKKTTVGRSGCRVEEFLDLDGQEALIRSLAVASDARIIFTTKDHRQDHILSPAQREGFAAVLALYDSGVPPAPPESPGNDKDITLPKNLHRVTPEFPVDMRARHKRGRVVVHAKVLKDGETEILDVFDSDAPYCGFEEAAFQAIRQWRYAPAMKGTEPVDVHFTIVIDFTFR